MTARETSQPRGSFSDTQRFNELLVLIIAFDISQTQGLFFHTIQDEEDSCQARSESLHFLK